MSKVLTLGRVTSFGAKNSLKIKWLPAMPAVVTVMIILTCLLGVFYLVGNNHLAVKGYEMKELEKRLDTLSEQSKVLELKALGLNALPSIEARLAEKGLVVTGQAEYLSPGDSSVASR